MLQVRAQLRQVGLCFRRLADGRRRGGMGRLLQAAAASVVRSSTLFPQTIFPSDHPLLQVRAQLGQVDPCFGRLADGMVAWIDCWRQLQQA